MEGLRTVNERIRLQGDRSEIRAASLLFMPSNTTRIAKNTLMLYFRQILIMLVSLYTVRVVLNTLGAEDYEIYNMATGLLPLEARSF
jgi:hypothetical protein